MMDAESNENDFDPKPIGFEMYGMDGYEGTENVIEKTENPDEYNNGRRKESPDGYTSSTRSDKVDRADDMYFRDGVRHIDYVLSYRDSPEREEKRRVFEQNLEQGGLELELEDKELSQDQKTYFVKIHAPWETLIREAELLKIKMPIGLNDIAEEDRKRWWNKIPNPFAIEQELIPDEEDYFTMAFRQDHMDQFRIENKETFFTNAQRSRIVYEILSRTHYTPEPEEGSTKKVKFGIKKLLSNNSYTGAFPLHEGKYLSGHSILTGHVYTKRQLLYECWARPGRWCYFQPLDQIREYFGEKIAIYFTWLGFYTGMLIPASIVGILCFVYGLVTVTSNIPSSDICNGNTSSLVLCPACDVACNFRELGSSCDYARLAHVFDNSITVIFTMFMSLWSTMFLELWKRKQVEIAWDWDVQDFENEQETLRPEYEASVSHYAKNPVTQELEPYLPLYNKLFRFLLSAVTIFFMLLVVLGALLGVIIYRIVIFSLLYQQDTQLVKDNAKLTTTATAACINLIIIMLLSRVYYRLAVWLTDLECPRTQTEYEDAFTFKMYLFMFVNYYSSLIYIAFFKGTFGGPKIFGRAKEQGLGYRPEECDPAGCLVELAIQLIIIMGGKQAFNNFNEIVWPKLATWWRQRQSRAAIEDGLKYTRWEQDFDLQDYPPKGLFDEYLEMVIQFGFVTLFVAAFPLAPLFALINNIIEIRLDAYKFVTHVRRPLALRAQDIGIWHKILTGIAILGVVINGFVIAYTSDFVPRLVYRYAYSPDQSLHGYIENSLSVFKVTNATRPSDPTGFDGVEYCRYRGYYEPPESDDRYEPTLMFWHILCARFVFVVVFEHCIFLTTNIIAYMIPDTPTKIKIQMQRENKLAKEALFGSLEKKKHKGEA